MFRVTEDSLESSSPRCPRQNPHRCPRVTLPHLPPGELDPLHPGVLDPSAHVSWSMSIQTGWRGISSQSAFRVNVQLWHSSSMPGSFPLRHSSVPAACLESEFLKSKQRKSWWGTVRARKRIRNNLRIALLPNTEEGSIVPCRAPSPTHSR